MTPFDLSAAPSFLALGCAVPALAFVCKGLIRMKKSLLGVGLILALTAPLAAQVQYVTIADVTVTGTAASVFSASDVLAGNGHPAAQSATIAVVGATIRVTFDGTTPTTSLGLVLPPGNYTVVGTTALLNMQAIRDDSTNATISPVLVRQ